MFYKESHEDYKITYNKIEIGYSTYDSYLRYTGDSSLKKVNPKLISMLSTCMYDCDELKKKLFVKKNIKISIQSETVFNPLNSFFQLSLLNKINIFSRCGQNEISLRHYTNWKQRNTYRYNISQKIFNIIKKKNKKKIHNWFNEFKNKSFKAKSFGIDLRIAKFYKKKQININNRRSNISIQRRTELLTILCCLNDIISNIMSMEVLSTDYIYNISCIIYYRVSNQKVSYLDAEVVCFE